MGNVALLVSLLLLIFSPAARSATNPYVYDATNTLAGRATIVHLFEWKWTDIATECEQFLQYYGYGAVQVSPPNEHIMLYVNNDVPWFVRYQPVSYRLSSRSGSDAEFRDMVARCNKVGVRIIVDAVTNHMTGVGQASGTPGVGTSGTSSFNSADGVESFPAVPFGKNDFHDFACHQDIQDDDYKNNADHVRLCRLVGLLDLNGGSPYVRLKITAYLNDLVDAGVAGFRMDAAKHIYPADMAAILAGVKNVRADIFGSGKRPFVVHEVIDKGGEAIKVGEYVNIGRYTNFNFGVAVFNAVKKYSNFRDLSKLGPGFGYGNLEDHDVLNFVDNHDNQRDMPPTVIRYKDGDDYRLATSFMLAWSYGYPRVMSSYLFDSHDQGPPNEGSASGYKTKSPTFNGDKTCDTASGWMCEHRWPTIRQMSLFRSVAQGRAATEIVTDDHRLAFAREESGFYAINNNGGDWTRDFLTTLPAGTYCDQYNGALENGKCTGGSVNVDENGKATITVPTHAAFAISLASRVGGPPPPKPPPSGAFQKTVVFLYASTSLGQNLWLRGGAAQNRQCAVGNYQQPDDSCAIPIVHNTTTPFVYAEYRDWSQRDDYLDFEGAEQAQGTHDGDTARGTPLAYSTSDASAVEYQPLNKYGPGYWMVQFLVDCSKAENGWFEVKGFLDDWEPNVTQKACDGSIGGSAPFSAPNHVAKCGAVNVFRWSESNCIIDGF